MGISMANVEQTAQGLASLGRYGDSMMVHMNPNEVAGLQQLAEAHGTTLTINPDTGMPEAFLGEFIGSLLPTFAGVAGGAVGGPAGAAAAGALTSYAQGNRDPLQIAMGGLSGYGGGQIGSALGGGAAPLAGSAEALTAAGTPEALAAQTFNTPVSNVMGANQMANVSNLPTAQLNQIASNNLQHLGRGAKVPPGVKPTQSEIFNIETIDQFGGTTPPTQSYQPSFMDTTGTAFEKTSLEFPKQNVPVGYQGPGRPLAGPPQQIITMEENLRPLTDSNLTPQLQNFDYSNANIGKPIGGAVMSGGGAEPLTQGLNLGREFSSGLDSLKASGRGITNAFENPKDFLEKLGGKEYTDAAGNIVNKGGEGSALYGGFKLGAPIAMAGAEGYYSDMYDTVDPIMRGGPGGPLNLSDVVRPSMTLPVYAAQGGMIPSYQAGGIAGLGYGGLLEGTGDGISDSIPAEIDGEQPAALSKGEFVVPARIVSELGNGSSQAGAERLYAMMDRVEKDREKTTGQGNIAVDTNAERRLPA
jgi:hypothetical protein